MTSGPCTLMLFPLGARERYLVEIERGESPRDFFYGGLHLASRGVPVDFGNTRRDPQGVLDRLLLKGEMLRNRVTNFGMSRQRVTALAGELAAADIALSFTDGFSVSLGLFRDDLAGDARLVGGFHGLADMVEAVPPPFRAWAARRIAQGIHRLDHLFFFGEADRREVVRRYGVPDAKTSLFRFGIDTDFWSPSANAANEDFVFSVGSDPKRDYATLLDARLGARLRIVTRLPVRQLAGRDDVEIIRGSYYGSPVSHVVLRDVYRSAAVVTVPVRDVFQPSGYSVSLQAMACGKPVVLSHIKGLWDPELFVSGENCILVPPGDPGELAEAVNRLLGDAALRRRIGDAAHRTAVGHFGLERMNHSLEDLIARLASAPLQVAG